VVQTTIEDALPRALGLPCRPIEVIEAVDAGAEGLMQRRDRGDERAQALVARVAAMRPVGRLRVDRPEEMRDHDQDAHHGSAMRWRDGLTLKGIVAGKIIPFPCNSVGSRPNVRDVPGETHARAGLHEYLIFPQY
jgi:hypothetical protein